MIELPDDGGIEGHGTLLCAIHPHGHATVLNALNRAEFAVGDAKLFDRRYELETVAGGELALLLSEDIHPTQAARIVSDGSTIRAFDSQQICLRIDGSYRREAVSVEAQFFATSVVLEHVTDDVPRGPGTVCSGDI